MKRATNIECPYEVCETGLCHAGSRPFFCFIPLLRRFLCVTLFKFQHNEEKNWISQKFVIKSKWHTQISLTGIRIHRRNICLNSKSLCSLCASIGVMRQMCSLSIGMHGFCVYFTMRQNFCYCSQSFFQNKLRKKTLLNRTVSLRMLNFSQ